MSFYVVLTDTGINANRDTLGNVCAFLSLKEAQDFSEKRKLKNPMYINIDNDIKEHNLEKTALWYLKDLKYLNSESQRKYSIWKNAFNDKYINGFDILLYSKSNDEYIKDLEAVLNTYCEKINTFAFKYESGLYHKVKDICKDILKIIKLYCEGKIEQSKNILLAILEPYMEDAFWVSELDKSYAFRGNAPFSILHSRDLKYKTLYEQMNTTELSFFRSRYEDTQLKKREEMLHIPFSKKGIINEQRFNTKGNPCLYLGVTSFVCWEECMSYKKIQFNSKNSNFKPENFYVSSFKFNDTGKKLKIFNLISSPHLINGLTSHIYNCNDMDYINLKKLQLSMVQLFPLVLATSYVVDHKKKDEKKYEYIISQLIVECLKDLKINGLAYLSKQGKDDFQYPQGVNLVIPMFEKDCKDGENYSSYCKLFTLTKPVNYSTLLITKPEYHYKKSYVNSFYSGSGYSEIVHYEQKETPYDNIDFHKFDEYLVRQEFDLYNKD